MKLIHIGCGYKPINGFVNYDSNLFLFFKYLPFSDKFLSLFNFIPKSFIKFVTIAKEYNVLYCDASKRIPEKDDTIDLIYSCHMLEHLDWDESLIFFDEAHRVLKKDGILRIVVPDFDHLINKYINNKNVDKFIYSSCLVGKKPKTLIKKIQYILQGHGWHHQMFSSNSIKKFNQLGFKEVLEYKSGDTSINFATSIDFYERQGESLYFEFIK